MGAFVRLWKIALPRPYHCHLNASNRNNSPETLMNAPVATASQPLVLTAMEDGVATLTLNRGERFNPLSMAMIAALETALDAIAGDASIRVVVVAATGRGFCAGHDLKEMREHPELGWQRELFESCGRMMQKLTRLPQPVIARVQGIATAAGCQLVAMCDLAVASDSAKFGLPGVNVGVFCTTPAVGVARNIARKRVMEMLFTGEMIDAPTALAWGLVNRVVPAAELDVAVGAFAGTISARSAAIVALGKRAFYQQIDRGLADAYEFSGEVMAGNLLLPDAGEGIDAFLGKRAPRWSDR
jgi:enoyl-CoA hydratase/carnithine racemase